MAALVTLGNQLATITSRSNLDCSSVGVTSLSASHTLPTRTIVRVLVKATVRRHTQMSYIRLDGSHDDESEGEAASPETPELLLRSELSFVMSSSVLLPSPSHNCG
ncbi:unnamed protein product [Knipowitschia caucasica]